MLPFIIAGSAVGGAVTLKLVEYGITYVRNRRAQAVAPIQEPVVQATAPKKNTRRAKTDTASLVARAEAATKKATVSDAKPPEKTAQGRPSLAAQIAALPGVEKA